MTFLSNLLTDQSIQFYIVVIPECYFLSTVYLHFFLGVNVAEALVSKGLASVVRHKHDDDERSSHYNDLLSAEEKAKKSNKGMYSKNAPNRRITDMAGDVNKSKQFLPFLQRAGRMQAVVEFVASGSRFRVYIPRETCVVTLLLAGK